MAATSGHGNPKWMRDEVILALDLYFQLDGKVPSSTDQRIVNLSQLLRRLPYHEIAAKKPSNQEVAIAQESAPTMARVPGPAYPKTMSLRFAPPAPQEENQGNTEVEASIAAFFGVSATSATSTIMATSTATSTVK